jgi:hypothetical protein
MTLLLDTSVQDLLNFPEGGQRICSAADSGLNVAGAIQSA